MIPYGRQQITEADIEAEVAMERRPDHRARADEAEQFFQQRSPIAGRQRQ